MKRQGETPRSFRQPPPRKPFDAHLPAGHRDRPRAGGHRALPRLQPRPLAPGPRLDRRPAWIGGSWETLVTQSSASNSEASFYLAFIVALHVATALALLFFFRSDWVRIVRGFFRTLRPSWAARRIVARDGDERLAWLLVIGTIPVGITGLALEHVFRTLFA